MKIVPLKISHAGHHLTIAFGACIALLFSVIALLSFGYIGFILSLVGFVVIGISQYIFSAYAADIGAHLVHPSLYHAKITLPLGLTLLLFGANKLFLGHVVVPAIATGIFLSWLITIGLCLALKTTDQHLFLPCFLAAQISAWFFVWRLAFPQSSRLIIVIALLTITIGTFVTEYIYLLLQKRRN